MERNIEWEPKSNRWTGAELRTVLKGAAELGNAKWQEVTEENKSSFRFFRVEVEQP